MRIYIFSRPIHSGKTSELVQWCNRQENIYGILMPDINGSRKIFDIHTKNVSDIECTDLAANTEPLTVVGRFHFYSAVFEKANSILLNELAQSPAWLVIDEAGKLELDKRGLYEGIIKAVAHFNNENNAGNLLITVRDSLCEEVIDFFGIKNYRIIHTLEGID
jgi:nucleoside-triphosphatase THEP1